MVTCVTVTVPIGRHRYGHWNRYVLNVCAYLFSAHNSSDGDLKRVRNCALPQVISETGLWVACICVNGRNVNMCYRNCSHRRPQIWALKQIYAHTSVRICSLPITVLISIVWNVLQCYSTTDIHSYGLPVFVLKVEDYSFHHVKCLCNIIH